MRLASLTVAALLLAQAESAAAFCRSTSCVGDCERDFDGCKVEGAPLYWPSLCVGFALDAQASEHITLDVAREVVRRSATTWSSLECPKGEATLAFVETEPLPCHVAEFLPDGPNVNAILFQDTQWSYKSADNSLAKTTVTYDKTSGEIFDADIELNHAYNELTVGDEEVVYDLESIVTHELGHFLGLDHSLDFDATMNASYNPGTIELRTVEQDDVAGVCAIYPPGRAATCAPTPRGGLAERCGPDDEGGCSVARSAAELDVAPSVLFGVVAACAIARWRLRRRRGSR
ncbi:MAG: matrixin family metalloprotease [Deltaproteobacteria bacterium]|nr:matrixin family metalloprotease [Deltaproteobacteria bacterium]